MPEECFWVRVDHLHIPKSQHYCSLVHDIVACDELGTQTPAAGYMQCVQEPELGFRAEIHFSARR